MSVQMCPRCMPPGDPGCPYCGGEYVVTTGAELARRHVRARSSSTLRHFASDHAAARDRYDQLPVCDFPPANGSEAVA